MAEYDADVPAGIVMTSMEAIVGWLRKTSFWPLTMGLACCAIEMISYGGPRADAARWGHEVFRASPRQADLMIVSARTVISSSPATTLTVCGPVKLATPSRRSTLPSSMAWLVRFNVAMRVSRSATAEVK